MKRVIKVAEADDSLKQRVYDLVVKYYEEHEDEIVDDYEDYKHKYDLYDTSFLSFLSDNRGKYFDQAVVNAVSPEEGKRAIFLLSAMDEETFEDLLF